MKGGGSNEEELIFDDRRGTRSEEKQRADMADGRQWEVYTHSRGRECAGSRAIKTRGARALSILAGRRSDRTRLFVCRERLEKGGTNERSSMHPTPIPCNSESIGRFDLPLAFPR